MEIICSFWIHFKRIDLPGGVSCVMNICYTGKGPPTAQLSVKKPGGSGFRLGGGGISPGQDVGGEEGGVGIQERG